MDEYMFSATQKTDHNNDSTANSSTLPGLFVNSARTFQYKKKNFINVSLNSSSLKVKDAIFGILDG